MKQYMLLGAAALVLTACDSHVGDAKQIIKEQLVDPSSARFEDVVVQRAKTSKDGVHHPLAKPIVCGWVNAKNRMGAYSGAQRFVVREGFSTFETKDLEWHAAFSNCISSTSAPGPGERDMRETTRDLNQAVDAYREAARAAVQ